MKKLILIICLVATNSTLFAQGCSDAGICSVGKTFESSESSVNNTIEVATVFGVGEADVTYISPYIAYTRKLSDKFSLTTRITFSSANGSFGTRASFGDAFVIGNYIFNEKDSKQWSVVAGWKIPFTSANLKINGFSLPLDYQASLGTFDLFLGTNLKYKKWDFNAVIQIPVFNNNKNSYFSEFSGTTDFPSTNLFQRKSDALFRATYSLKTKNQKFVFKPNLLFIYHLGEDSYETIFAQRQTIVGSHGLTINGNLLSIYNLDKKNSIELSIATPFEVRDSRPDGLTRALVVGMSYKFSF